MDDELVIEQVDRDALCDILGVPRDWASPDKDGNKELARALPVLARHRIAAEAQARTQGMQWRDAIDEALICWHLGTWESFPDAKAALHALIAWEVQVALNPDASQAARDLHRAGMLEAAAIVERMIPPGTVNRSKCIEAIRTAAGEKA